MDGTDVICIGYMLSYLFKVYFIPYMWQVEFASVCNESGLVDSYVNGFFDCSLNVLLFPAYGLKILHRCSVVCCVVIFIYGRWCFQTFFKSVTKRSGWLSKVFIFKVYSVTLEPVNDITLVWFCPCPLVILEVSSRFFNF